MRLEHRLAAYLESSDLLSAADLRRAQNAAAAAHRRLDQALLELGLLSEVVLGEILRDELGVRDVETVPDAAVEIDAPATYFLSKGLLPIACDSETLHLAMIDAFDDQAAQAMRLKCEREVIRWSIDRRRFDEAWVALYGETGEVIEPDALPSAGANAADVVALKESASDAPVVRFVHDTIVRAVTAGASDIHLKPLAQGGEVLFRIDGRLEGQPTPDPLIYAAVISRLKILANLDIAERRLPQDGKLALSVGGRVVDVRISTMAHVLGEGAVLRLLSRQLIRTSLGDLGFSPDIEAGLRQLVSTSEGLVLVVGPTGSGKSTTLHALLQQLIRPDLNIVTVEDPVEYKVEGISQIQIDEKAGLTFPRVLRSLLRQDPDIILVGEIRDAETAAIAVQAALTGHLVLATLHTNSALAAVPRLVDMGVEPYLLAAVLRGVLAQRLVRRHRSSGRLAIGELALLDSDTIEALAQSTTLPPELKGRLAARGYRPMREDAERRVLASEIATEDLAAA